MVHYYGYAGKTTHPALDGIYPCGVKVNREDTVEATGYAHSVTCPGCKSALVAAFESSVVAQGFSKDMLQLEDERCLAILDEIIASGVKIGDDARTGKPRRSSE